MWLDPGKKKGFAMLIDVGTMGSNTFRQRDVAAGVEGGGGESAGGEKDDVRLQEKGRREGMRGRWMEEKMIKSQVGGD